MPPSQIPEVKEISQRMAHLSALLQIPRPTSEVKPLWFEYRDLKARREAIEAEANAGQTAAPKPSSISGSSVPVDAQKSRERVKNSRIPMKDTRGAVLSKMKISR
jgi:hypothetical protein